MATLTMDDRSQPLLTRLMDAEFRLDYEADGRFALEQPASPAGVRRLIRDCVDHFQDLNRKPAMAVDPDLMATQHGPRPIEQLIAAQKRCIAKCALQLTPMLISALADLTDPEKRGQAFMRLWVLARVDLDMADDIAVLLNIAADDMVPQVRRLLADPGTMKPGP